MRFFLFFLGPQTQTLQFGDSAPVVVAISYQRDFDENPVSASSDTTI